MSKKHPKPIPPILSGKCGPHVRRPIEFVGKIKSIEPIREGGYSLALGRDTRISLPGVAPDWMVAGAYVRFLFNQQNGKNGIALLSADEAEYFAKMEAEYANKDPFAADYGTT